MALRINEYVLGGELRNTSRNSITGWIEFAPDYGVSIKLCGNFSGQFAGKHFKFRVNKPESKRIPKEDLRDLVESMANQQVGVIGDVLFRQIKVPLVPVKELMLRSRLGEPAPFDIKDCLYLEWFSQDGRVVAEIIDPEFEFIDHDTSSTFAPVAEPIPGMDENADNEDAEPGNPDVGLSVTQIQIDENGEAVIEELEIDVDDASDEYQLFDADIDQQIRQSLNEDSNMVETDVDDPSSEPFGGQLADPDAAKPKKKSWDEIIPGIDPETKAQYEMWDEVYGGEKDQPLMSLFDPPFQLPDPDSITTDNEAQPYLNQIIMRLAMHSVGIDLCQHLTPLTAYRMLVNDILPNAIVHPNLAATDIVEHYSAFDFCPQCEAEFEQEYEYGESEDE